MIHAVIMMGGLGIIIGIVLAAASKIFYVYVDPLVEAVDEALPGANCGGCGLPGCSANAEAIVAGKAAPNSCVAGGAELAEAIASIMGVTVSAKEPDIALPGCTYGVPDADQKFIYNGLNDCRAAALINGGVKVCKIGCLGYGSCMQACPFNAIKMGLDGLPEVDIDLCTGCGTCERVCPKNIIKLSSITRRILAEYTTEECTTPCQRACPAGINIRDYIIEIERGNYSRAVQIIKERNPFPAVIGRICPRPCETDCRRQFVDESVAINFLKRYAADYEIKTGTRVLPYKAPQSGKKIAIIGGGVEGLSTGFFAARLGHESTVFEATDQVGGLLNSAISKLRLPADVLEWDINGIVDMGVSIVKNCTFGENETIQSLLATGYDALFFTTGGWDNRLARNTADAVTAILPNSYLLIDVLRHPEKIVIDGKVAIVGGDAIAIEKANDLLQKGADQITVILNKNLDQIGLDEKISSYMDNPKITVLMNSAISHVTGEANTLKSVTVLNLLKSEVKDYPVDALIFATGRYPEIIITKIKTEELPEESQEVKTDPMQWTTINPYKKPQNWSKKGLFAPGDPQNDFNAAIKAIAAGRRGAVSIHQLITEDVVPQLPTKVITPISSIQNVDSICNVKKESRQIMGLCAEIDLSEGKETEIGFSEAQAKKEASRCLKCGLICYQTDQQKNN